VRDRVIPAIKNQLSENGINLAYPMYEVLFHDQTEEVDGDRRRRAVWPAGKGNAPRPQCRLCETCGGSNRFSAKTCQTCGAPFGSSSLHEVVDTYSDAVQETNGELEITTEPGTIPPSEGEPPTFYKPASHDARVFTTGAGRASGWTPSFTLIGIVAVALVLLALLGLISSVGNDSARKAFESRV
jgi:hypothetical protein